MFPLMLSLMVRPMNNTILQCNILLCFPRSYSILAHINFISLYSSWHPYKTSAAESTHDALVNMSGIISSSMNWIVDFGATNHITCHREWLTNLKENISAFRFVCLLNGHKCKVTHIGDYFLSPSHFLTDVLLVDTICFQFQRCACNCNVKWFSLLILSSYRTFTMGRIWGMTSMLNIFTCFKFLLLMTYLPSLLDML